MAPPMLEPREHAHGRQERMDKVYSFAGRLVAVDDDAFAAAVSEAHACHRRPLCQCVVDGIEMYVARLGDGYVVKRMPNTGSRHAPECVSYEPPQDLSGLGQVIGGAIREDPVSGVTSLRLGFSLSRIAGRAQGPGTVTAGSSASSDGSRLSLRALLHYLWDQGELTRWQPGFAGRRSWATVRRHLLLAAGDKRVRDEALRDRLYVPEVFDVERRDEINARRIGRMAAAGAPANGARKLMLLVAEVKDLSPARYGFKAVLKHVPDQPFFLDETLHRRLQVRFSRELSLWNASEGVHLLAAGTFGIDQAGVPSFEELSLMATTLQWLPVEDAFELQLVERLVREGRAFRKQLRYNLRTDQPIASVVFTDTGARPVAIYVVRSDAGEAYLGQLARLRAETNLDAIEWHVEREVPPSPARAASPTRHDDVKAVL